MRCQLPDVVTFELLTPQQPQQQQVQHINKGTRNNYLTTTTTILTTTTTVCLGLTHSFSLGYNFIQVKSLDLIRKVVSVAEKTCLLTARHSSVLLRTKKHIQTLNPKCRKLDLYGETVCAKLGGLNYWAVMDRFC